MRCALIIGSHLTVTDAFRPVRGVGADRVEDALARKSACRSDGFGVDCRTIRAALMLVARGWTLLRRR